MITIDPSHVKGLGIDDLTFLVQKPVKGSILLDLRKLSFGITLIAELILGQAKRILSKFMSRMEKLSFRRHKV